MSARRWLIATALLLVLLAAVAIALRVGIAEPTAEIVWSIRAPRVVMALLVGSGLAIAGALMQGSLGNPLADPGLVGVSAGAALGAMAAVAVGASFNTVLTAAIACIGAAIATVVVVSVSMRDRRPEVVSIAPDVRCARRGRSPRHGRRCRGGGRRGRTAFDDEEFDAPVVGAAMHQDVVEDARLEAEGAGDVDQLAQAHAARSG